MKEEIIKQLEQLEKELIIYNTFLQSPEITKEQAGPVSFKFLHEMIRFKVLSGLVPEYKPAETQEILTAAGLFDTAGMVSIEDGKVKISPYFDEIFKMQDKFNNGKIS